MKLYKNVLSVLFATSIFTSTMLADPVSLENKPYYSTSPKSVLSGYRWFLER